MGDRLAMLAAIEANLGFLIVPLGLKAVLFNPSSLGDIINKLNNYKKEGYIL